MAICKPEIRRTARVGDWIVGLRSRRNDQVISAMRVDEVLSFGDYWNDARFRAKRPGRSGTPDNIYKPRRGGELQQVTNALHDATHAARDLRGTNVLVSWHYWYFGDQSPELPTHLIHLVHAGQGHSLQARRKTGDVRVHLSGGINITKRI